MGRRHEEPVSEVNPSDIGAGRAYRGCHGAAYHVEEIRDGLVFFRLDGVGTRTAIDLDTFSGLMMHEILTDAFKGHGD
ncbi:hypothetical protein [Neorhizobium galegae]|uniref:Uncharacterized protein n=1 Tax=Neorhizobium galegae bv. officinalis TaxID=323656 RepID=A0A0T7GUJ9_NEOGA|nr:hypothetical protein [Neorhizobium galegae]CDZ50933.1 Hypothetical protein NGAL_HAMBI1189_37060 [Neorhizobium galegae bv. officinalis]